MRTSYQSGISDVKPAPTESALALGNCCHPYLLMRTTTKTDRVRWTSLKAMIKCFSQSVQGAHSALRSNGATSASNVRCIGMKTDCPRIFNNEMHRVPEIAEFSLSIYLLMALCVMYTRSVLTSCSLRSGLHCKLCRNSIDPLDPPQSVRIHTIILNGIKLIKLVITRVVLSIECITKLSKFYQNLY